ncbi:hypothetical protein [Desulforamulus profundi]|uniref:hypothetical protein n=1 Tax=Desulforamulus profundi TaxID=1383067 RepID=UPI003082C428
MKSSLVITTGIRSANELEEKALELSRQLNVPYIRREKKSLAALREQGRADIILLVRQDKLSLVVDGNELFFHPGLAKLRIKEIQTGKTDQMIRAMNLEEGDSLLDCTLGLAADAWWPVMWWAPGGRLSAWRMPLRWRKSSDGV